MKHVFVCLLGGVGGGERGQRGRGVRMATASFLKLAEESQVARPTQAERHFKITSVLFQPGQ